jgi:MscS family membrane protein
MGEGVLDFVQFLGQWPWWVPIIVVFTGAVGLHVFLNLFYRYGFPDERKRGREWPAIILRAVKFPLKLFVWLSFIFFIVSLYANELFEISLVNVISNLFQVGFIASLSLTFYTFARELEKHFLIKRHYDRTSVELFSKLSLMVIIFCTLIIILPLFGIQIGGLLAFGGFSGIIVGLAARDAIANILGGIIIALDRPFRIGEWIYSDNGKIEGHVEHIGWRLTKVRQFDKRPIFIPNSMFSSMVFVNATRATNRRVLKTFMIRYQDVSKVSQVLQGIRTYIKESREIDQDQSNFAHLEDFADSSVDILVRVYSKTVDDKEFRVFQEKVLFDVYKIIRENGAEMAFPTSIVYLKKEGEK